MMWLKIQYTYALYVVYIYDLQPYDSIIVNPFSIDLDINYNQCDGIESVKTLYMVIGLDLLTTLKIIMRGVFRRGEIYFILFLVN